MKVVSAHMDTSKEIVGRVLKALRQKSNVTQQQLADLLEVDRQYIWRLENGKVNLTMDYLDKVIEKLNCNHEDFIVVNDLEVYFCVILHTEPSTEVK